MGDYDIYERLKNFAVAIVVLSQQLPRKPGVFRIIDQLVGSGTSPAANAREAKWGRSRAEFISCMGIALKELAETELWLEIIIELQWLPLHKVQPQLQECRELQKIVSTIILNAKENKNRSTAI